MELRLGEIEHVLGPAIAHSLPPSIIHQQSNDLDQSLRRTEKQLREPAVVGEKWHFFREDLFSSRFALVPAFAVGRVPLKVNICLHEDINLDAHPWSRLLPDIATIVQEKGLRPSKMTKLILRGLEHWSSTIASFKEDYMALPFGSQILIEKIGMEPQDTLAHFVPQYDLELQWLSMKRLQSMWNVSSDAWPPLIDLSELRVHDEPHAAISIVTIPEREGGIQFVFKSDVRHVKYLYHELRQLLLMKPHPHIIQRPLYLVTKRVNFGGKKGICGMILEYHAAGNLAQVLQPANPLLSTFDMKVRFQLAYQLATALEHIRDSHVSYFSDLKLDNILLKEKTKGGYDAVLIDFEQRGSWFSWSPPEINLVSHIVYLATRRGLSGLSSDMNREYAQFLQEHLPAWQRKTKSDVYINSDEGYNLAWLSLSADERETAMVFMFGKVLWCLFEMQPSVNAVTFLGADIFREVNPDFRFPEFRLTPPHLQSLVRDCTAGAPEWIDSTRSVFRSGNMIHAIATAAVGQAVGADAAEVISASADWWNRHLEAAKEYIIQRSSEGKMPQVSIRAAQRPKIDCVVSTLKSIGTSEGWLG
jgi:serine/threonine protein kinase